MILNLCIGQPNYYGRSFGISQCKNIICSDFKQDDPANKPIAQKTSSFIYSTIQQGMNCS
jgi:hypothetical protein